ncbi:XFP-like protein [Sinorhizobium medicae]|uniref:Xylulose 5-phosphate/Fructose 6-phosphate phosphoketolase N-terminal domain-containing protein n=1 Tax=Sinorhizobium medicae TaxID=110321 RepID=A0A508WYV5_9HYPH|nr:XFP-like protein [Sinorhizobium medicae]TWA25273.1 XFP-like protein [Sinorhizobium medicae]TWA37159.1 XFP-like protein [Sinorhizobium medicae]TWA38882.1 XFP-like protein [Sinorhizobium medicae]TWA40434.1 XFP-like protein [Sinorhizobium medicae]
MNMLYVHLNRVIKRDGLEMMYVIDPGHGGPSLVAHAFLEGTYSEVYPDISQDAEGMRKLFKQFSFPAVSRAMSRRKRRAAFTRAASSAMR